MCEKKIVDIIKIRRGTSKGITTSGYSTCTLRDITNKRIGSCNGGGFDMKGTVFAEYLVKKWSARLIAFAKNNLDCIPCFEHGKCLNPGVSSHKFYGMTVNMKGNTVHSVNINGGCGFNSMVSLAKNIGLELENLVYSHNYEEYQLIATE